MATYPALAPLGTPGQAPGLLGAASRELERQMLESIPAGKQGAELTVIDKTGITIGVATVLHTGKVEVKAAAEFKQKWEKTAPEASLKVQATW
jgi:hypothetical protein